MTTVYPFQERVDALVRSGRSVILQAPTGCGKTRAALFPFLDGWRNDPAAFPRQCLYAVPMRVLANQFGVDYKQTVNRYATSHGLRELGHVSIQTGACPEDRSFAGDLIFTTIDQLLSSFLTIPYSLSNLAALCRTPAPPAYPAVARQRYPIDGRWRAAPAGRHLVARAQ
jgi:CRISPR-associated endonuclease/helicase Cas3